MSVIDFLSISVAKYQVFLVSFILQIRLLPIYLTYNTYRCEHIILIYFIYNFLFILNVSENDAKLQISFIDVLVVFRVHR